MKKQFLLLAILTISTTTFAQNYSSAIGLKFSSNSGLGGSAITYKHFIKPNTAIEALVSFSDPIAIGALYQVYKNLGQTNSLQWYYGGGGYFAFSKPKVGLGATGVIGIDYKFDNVPINLSLDFKPELRILPTAGLDFNTFGFAIRYCIK